MPFEPKHNPKPYSYQQSPNMQGSDRLFFDRELRSLGQKVNEIVEAVKEMQEYVKTL